MKTTAMRLSNIELFQIVKGKLGEKEAKSLVNYIETQVKDEFDTQRSIYASKEDLARVQGALEIKNEKVQGALETKIGALETKLEKGLGSLETKIEATKNTVILWTVATIISVMSLAYLIMN